MPKKVAVVILNYNGAPLLEQYLPSVCAFSDLANLYVIDNASTDKSLQFLKENYPEINLICLDENYGYAGGYNLGLKDLREDYFCLLNSDIRVTANWLEPILELFAQDETIAAIQPKILDDKKPDYFEYAGAAGGFIDAFGVPYCRGRLFDKIEKDEGQYNDSKEIFWASGACLFLRKEAFQNVDGFDASFFAHQEEIDLCWRLKNNNYKVYYQGKSTVYHLGGATLNDSSPHKTFLNFRNSLFMLNKNLPTTVRYRRLFGRLCIDGLIGIKFLLSGHVHHFISILKAHFAFYKVFFKLKKRTASKNDYFHKYSIIWSYYFKGYKTFKD
jgi:GT2 family glycosyltransferase